MNRLFRRKHSPAPLPQRVPVADLAPPRIPPAVAEFHLHQARESAREVRAEQVRLAFEDGQAYTEGARAPGRMAALWVAAGELSDPVHGARRAMLVLAGHAGHPVESLVGVA